MLMVEEPVHTSWMAPARERKYLINLRSLELWLWGFFVGYLGLWGTEELKVHRLLEDEL